MEHFKSINAYSGLPRSIYFLFLARIINCLGNFVFPFLTLFLTNNLGISEEVAGVYLTIASFVYVPGSLLGGKLADIFGRKKIMIAFQALAALCLVPCAFLGKSIVIPWLLILSGLFGGAAQPANTAMVADLTNHKNRKEAFSLLYLGINIGTAFGPLIAGFLYKNYLKWIFIGDAATTFISLFFVIRYVDESKPAKEAMEEEKELDDDERAEEGSVIVTLIRRPLILAFSLISAIYSFVYVQNSFSMPLQIEEIFGGKEAEIFGTLMSINAIVVITMTTLIIKATRKIKPILNMVMAGIFYAVGFGMMFFIRSYPLFIISTIIWTIGEILSSTNSGVYIANHTPVSHRGRFNAITNIISGAGQTIGPWVMGGVIVNYSVRMVWPLTFIAALFAAGLMFVLFIIEEKVMHNKKQIYCIYK